MDALAFAAQLGTTRLHNLISGTCGKDGDARVWLRNGWGIRITEVYPDNTARVETVAFAEPFNPDWQSEPVWQAITPVREFLPEYAIPCGGWTPGSFNGGTWDGLSVVRVADLLEHLYGYDRVQPLKTR